MSHNGESVRPSSKQNNRRGNKNTIKDDRQKDR